MFTIYQKMEQDFATSQPSTVFQKGPTLRKQTLQSHSSLGLIIPLLQCGKPKYLHTIPNKTP